MCCVPLAGTGEGWVKVVVRKVKKRKREVVLRDRKEEEGKGEKVCIGGSAVQRLSRVGSRQAEQALHLVPVYQYY